MLVAVVVARLVLAAPVAPPTPDLHPRHVADLAHLSELVRDDPVLRARTASIQVRRTRAIGIALASVVSGTTAMVAAHFQGSPTLRTVGLTLVVAGPIAGAVSFPASEETAEAVALWNARHPTEMLAIR